MLLHFLKHYRKCTPLKRSNERPKQSEAAKSKNNGRKKAKNKTTKTKKTKNKKKQKQKTKQQHNGRCVPKIVSPEAIFFKCTILLG